LALGFLDRARIAAMAALAAGPVAAALFVVTAAAGRIAAFAGPTKTRQWSAEWLALHVPHGFLDFFHSANGRTDHFAATLGASAAVLAAGGCLAASDAALPTDRRAGRQKADGHG
jgi:hypothetical protein